MPVGNHSGKVIKNGIKSLLNEADERENLFNHLGSLTTIELLKSL